MTNTELFELKTQDKDLLVKVHLVDKQRMLIGRSENCDIIIAHDAVSTVHAVIEISQNHIKLFDLDSTNGTYVNGERIIAADIKLNDRLTFADKTFSLLSFKKEDAPPVLDGLDPIDGKAFTRFDKEDHDFKIEKALPVAPLMDESAQNVPAVVYPLASDPKSDFTEYIFEDASNIFPIFKYDVNKTSIEVMFIFNERVMGVDYIPTIEGEYLLTGWKRSRASNIIEYPYLGKDETVPFIEVTKEGINLHRIPGFTALHLNEAERKDYDLPSQVPAIIDLKPQDMVKFRHERLEIFVRSVESPPYVQPAPVLQRDDTLRKYILIALLFVTFVFGGLMLFTVDEQIEKEKAPERIAEILYKQKMSLKKTKAVEKTKLKENRKQTISKSAKVAKELDKKSSKKEKVRAKSKPKGLKAAKKVKVVKQRTTTKKQTSKKLSARKSKQLGGKNTRPSNRSRRATVTTKSQGHIDTYKAVDFSSSIKSVLAKSGKASGDIAIANDASSSGFTESLAGAGDTQNLKYAKVKSNVGSITGAAKGKIDVSKGAEGIVSKGTILTAGVPSDTVVLGSMDPEVIRQILREHIPQFRYCYQRELDSASRDVQGIVKLNFTIGASGHVTHAGVESRLSRRVRACATRVLRGIQFPEPRGGGIVEVSQPINFYPKRL